MGHVDRASRVEEKLPVLSKSRDIVAVKIEVDDVGMIKQNINSHQCVRSFTP